VGGGRRSTRCKGGGGYTFDPNAAGFPQKESGFLASFPPVEAVVRTLTLLESLNRYPVASLAQLHHQTGIPKPSLVRLLQTLEGMGYVRRAPKLGSYQLTSKVRVLASGFHSEPRIVEVVAPLLDALTATVKWPAALVLPDQGAAVIRYSTTPRSPLALLHSTIDMRLSLATRALGRACLAFCGEEEREVLIRESLASGDPESRAALDRRSLDANLELVRRQGYALRDPKVRPVSKTLAIPLFDANRVVGAIGITWFASTMSDEEAIARYLAPLRRVADEAKVALSRLDESAETSAPQDV